ncbi:hypothetical protein SDC9_122212 [bioreactor metagenome]|uniref:Uncharacterized protein n=1 Tax=bioreactor metagenome TaxID=1076179 RepID=A0A645CE58_9ZZZZ
MQRQPHQAGDHLDRLAHGQPVHRQMLGELIEPVQQRHHDRHQDAELPGCRRGAGSTCRHPAWRALPIHLTRLGSRSGYRLSWRCLQETHIVARGKASSRALPIGLPQFSQYP